MLESIAEDLAPAEENTAAELSKDDLFSESTFSIILEQKDGYTYGYTENYLRVCVKGDIPRGKYQILCQTLIENEIIATLCE